MTFAAQQAGEQGVEGLHDVYVVATRALKIGMHNLVDRPLRTRLFLQLAAGNVSNNDDFPMWAQRQGGTIIGKDSAGNPKFVSRRWVVL